MTEPSIIPASREASRPSSTRSSPSKCSNNEFELISSIQAPTVPLSVHLQEIEKLQKNHDQAIRRERVRVADAIMDRANITLDGGELMNSTLLICSFFQPPPHYAFMCYYSQKRFYRATVYAPRAAGNEGWHHSRSDPRVPSETCRGICVCAQYYRIIIVAIIYIILSNSLPR
jgi:hypothetical protein